MDSSMVVIYKLNIPEKEVFERIKAHTNNDINTPLSEVLSKIDKAKISLLESSGWFAETNENESNENEEYTSFCESHTFAISSSDANSSFQCLYSKIMRPEDIKTKIAENNVDDLFGEDFCSKKNSIVLCKYLVSKYPKKLRKIYFLSFFSVAFFIAVDAVLTRYSGFYFSLLIATVLFVVGCSFFVSGTNISGEKNAYDFLEGLFGQNIVGKKELSLG